MTLPAAQQSRLPNGLRLVVVPMHEVPIVQFEVRVAGGAREDASLPGLATFTANMLDEGAGARDATGIAAEAAYLGASLFTGADWNATSVSLRVPKRTLGPALDLMADVVLRPTFLGSEVTRQRDLRIANLIQQRDVPAAVATLAYNSIVFPEGHPYHRPINGDSTSTAALDSATVRSFYQRTVLPERTTVLVTGDITLADARREIERRFGTWPSAERRVPNAERRAPSAEPRFTARSVYLVDKPNAPQSVIRIGHPGVERNHPDYYAIQVMNTLLGGSFSSRLMTNLRETKGYTYGARSGFDFQPLPGAFTSSADVRTDVTDSSLVEFFKELNLIRDSLAAPDELERTKNYLALRLPGAFETTGQVSGQIGSLLLFDLPFTWFNDYVKRILAVTAEDVRRVARTHIRPDSVTVVVVGDVAKIRPGIERLNLGPMVVRKPT
ncbi:MAG: M16 family metallopeptidase [Gemmatimonadales bacterium]